MGGLFLVAALALTASGCKKAAPSQPPPPVVEVMEVAKKNVARSTTFIGQLDSPQNVEVRARVESFVERIPFEEGTEVQAGAPLFELDKKPYEERLAAAKGGLAQAKAALSKSTIEVPRLTALAAQKAVEKDLDTAVATKEANEANVDVGRGKSEIGGTGSRVLRREGADCGAHRREAGFDRHPRRKRRAYAADHLAGRSDLVLLFDQ